jgi:hypothetical protein
MRDLFEYLSQQETAPQILVLPVLPPIFPLTTPERNAHIGKIAPVSNTYAAQNTAVPANAPATIPRGAPSADKPAATVTPQSSVSPKETSEPSASRDSGDPRNDDQTRAVWEHKPRDTESLSLKVDGARELEPVIQDAPPIRQMVVVEQALNPPRLEQIHPALDTGALPDSPAAPIAINTPAEIHISIGKIEVRAAEAPKKPNNTTVRRTTPLLSLEDYLRARSGES